jgi:hypothetical protein
MRFLLVLLFSFLVSCAGTQTPGGTTLAGLDVNWTLGVGIGISVAQAALPAAQAALDGNPAITPATRAQIDIGFRAALDALPLATTALNTFSHAPTNTAALCQVHFYLEAALTGALQALVVAKDAGATIDPMVSSAIGGIASAADMLFSSACASSAAPVHGRRISAQERVRSVMASR